MYLFLGLDVLGLCCCEGFSLVVESGGLLSSCGARASHCGGFLLQSVGLSVCGCRLQALEHTLSSCGAWTLLP